MTELFNPLSAIPGWFITSFIVVFMSILNYVAFRASVGKDIQFNRMGIERNDDNINKLFEKTDALERDKVDTGQVTVFRAETMSNVESFKNDVRENLREFKNDIRSDINNVLVAIKKNNGAK